MTDERTRIHPTSIVNPHVRLGENSRIGPFCILGEPARGKDPGEEPLTFGMDTLVRSHTVIYAGNVIGDHFQTGHNVLIREHNHIGDHVSIGTGSVIEHHVRMGHHVRCHSNVFVPEYSILDDHAWLGPNVVITNAKYPKSASVKELLRGAHVKTHAKVGANATLLPGVVIGEYALVGAGAVVTEDVCEYAVVVGNPAQEINDVRKLPYDELQHLLQAEEET